MEHHGKNPLATWGLEPASLVSVVNRHTISSRPSYIPKKDASSCIPKGCMLIRELTT